MVSLGAWAAPGPYLKPWFKVLCEYEVEHDGRITTSTLTLNILAVDGRPGRWHVSLHHKA
jgi:hypothetical protein